MVGILALAGALTQITPASAHFCAQPTQAQVGQPLTISLGVPAEQSAVTSVDLTIPDGFRLNDIDPGEGWKAHRDGQRVRFTGGKVPPFGCTYFVLRGEVMRKGRIKFPLTTGHEDGSRSKYDGDKIGDPYGAQLVFAGVEIRSSDYVGTDEGGGGAPGWAMYLMTVLVGVGIGGGAGLLARWRARQQSESDRSHASRRTSRRR